VSLGWAFLIGYVAARTKKHTFIAVGNFEQYREEENY